MEECGYMKDSMKQTISLELGSGWATWCKTGRFTAPKRGAKEIP